MKVPWESRIGLMYHALNYNFRDIINNFIGFFLGGGLVWPEGWQWIFGQSIKNFAKYLSQNCQRFQILTFWLTFVSGWWRSRFNGRRQLASFHGASQEIGCLVSSVKTSSSIIICWKEEKNISRQNFHFRWKLWSLSPIFIIFKLFKLRARYRYPLLCFSMSRQSSFSFA